MKKFFKIIIAILGAINVMFGIFIPIAVALMLVKFYPLLGTFSRSTVIIAGMLSSLYKAINVGILKQEVIQ